MTRHWPVFRSFWFHVPHPKAANDNVNAAVDVIAPTRTVQTLARELAYRLDRQRFMTAWTSVDRTANS